MTRRRQAVGVLAAVSLLATSCAGDGSEDSGRQPERPATTTTAPPATTTSDAAADDDAPVVVAVGDIACGPNERGNGSADVCQHRATADLAAEIDPDAVLLLGDLQYPKGEYENFLASYDKTWGRFKDRSYPAPGNHEYSTSGAAGYFRYWGDRAGASGQGWYAIEIGQWKVIALNSNCSAVGCGAGSAQEQWLRRELAATTEKCTLAFWHHPRYSSGLHGSDSSVEPLWVALSEAGADVVLAGHDHHYERLAPQRGLRTFIVGTGGKSLYPVFNPFPGSEGHSDSTYGVLELRLGVDAYTWEFHAIGGDPFTDTGSERCR